MFEVPKEKCFLVGGAVRDSLLGLEQNDHDYTVVGVSEKQMLDWGFSRVGKDFPVFLDNNGTEFALARTERKTGNGYAGFETFTENVSLEEDLVRRDLTMNAMAQNWRGEIIDPFGGQKDIRDRVIRHVGDAFSEDPVRVLRVARFAAKYHHMGFVIHPTTMDLMKSMVKSGEVDHLVPERVWAEFVKVINTKTPSVFLRVLHDCGALAKIMPEVDALYGVPQVALYHPEVDTGTHIEMVLDQACKLAPGNTAIAFAALAHDLGKGLTPQDELPKHHNHEATGVAPVKTLSDRLKVPADCKALAISACAYHLKAHRSLESRPGTLYDLIMDVGLQNSKKFDEFLLVCEADKRGRLGVEDGDYPQGDFLRAVFQACKQVSGQPFADLPVKTIIEKIRTARIKAIHIRSIEWKKLQKNITPTEPEAQAETIIKKVSLT